MSQVESKRVLSKKSTLSIDDLGQAVESGADLAAEGTQQALGGRNGNGGRSGQRHGIKEGNRQLSVTSRNYSGGDELRKASGAESQQRRSGGADDDGTLRQGRESSISSADKLGASQPSIRKPLELETPLACGRAEGEESTQLIQPRVPKLDFGPKEARPDPSPPIQANGAKPPLPPSGEGRSPKEASGGKSNQTGQPQSDAVRGDPAEARTSGHGCGDSSCMMSQHNYQDYLKNKLRWSTSGADQVFQVGKPRHQRDQGSRKAGDAGSQDSGRATQKRNAASLLSGTRPPRLCDRNAAAGQDFPVLKGALTRPAQSPTSGSPTSGSNHRQQYSTLISPSSTNRADEAHKRTRYGAPNNDFAQSLRLQGAHRLNPADAGLSDNFEQFNKFAKVLGTSDLDRGQKQEILDQLIAESQETQRLAREKVDQETSEREEEQVVEHEMGLPDAVILQNQDEVELENYVQRRLQQPPVKALAPVGPGHLRSRIKTQGADVSIASAPDYELQRNIMAELSQQSRPGFVFSPKLSMYATNNSFSSRAGGAGQRRQGRDEIIWKQKDADAGTSHAENSIGISSRYAGPGIPSTAPKLNIRSGEQAFGGIMGAQLMDNSTEQVRAHDSLKYSGAAMTGRERSQQVYLVGQQNRRKGEMQQQRYDVSETTPLLDQLVMTKSGNKKMCQRELRNLLRLMHKQKGLTARPGNFAASSGDHGQSVTSASKGTGANDQDQGSVHQQLITFDGLPQSLDQQDLPEGAGAGGASYGYQGRAVSQPAVSVHLPYTLPGSSHQGKGAPPECSKTQRTTIVHANPGQKAEGGRHAYSSPQDQHNQFNLQSLTKEWGFCEEENEKKSQAHSFMASTFRSKLASTTRATAPEQTKVLPKLEEPANISYMCQQMKQKFINEKRLQTQRCTVRNLSRKLNQYRKDNNHVLVRREYLFKTISHKNKWDTLLPNDDGNNGGFQEKFSLLHVQNPDLAQSLDEGSQANRDSVQYSMTVLGSLNGDAALHSREAMIKKLGSFGYAESKLQQQASQIANAKGLDQARAQGLQVDQMNSMYGNYYDAYQKYENFQIMKDVDRLVASKIRSRRRSQNESGGVALDAALGKQTGPRLDGWHNGMSISNPVKWRKPGPPSEICNPTDQAPKGKLDGTSTSSKWTPRSPASHSKQQPYVVNSRNITVRDYHDAKHLAQNDSNYIDDVKSGDLASHAAGLGADSATALGQPRYQNQTVEHEWQSPLYSGREPMAANSKQFEVGGQRISPVRTLRNRDLGAELQSTERRIHEQRSAGKKKTLPQHPTTRIPLLHQLTAKKPNDLPVTDIAPTMELKATIHNTATTSIRQELEMTAIAEASSMSQLDAASKQRHLKGQSSRGDVDPVAVSISLRDSMASKGQVVKAQNSQNSIVSKGSKRATDSQPMSHKQSEDQRLQDKYDNQPALGHFTESDGQILNELLSQQDLSRITQSSQAPRPRAIGYNQMRNYQRPLLLMDPRFPSMNPGYARNETTGVSPMMATLEGSRTTKHGDRQDSHSPLNRIGVSDAVGFYEQALIYGSVKAKGSLIKPNESSSQRQKNNLVARSVITKKVQEAKLRLEKMERQQRSTNRQWQTVDQHEGRKWDPARQVAGYPTQGAPDFPPVPPSLSLVQAGNVNKVGGGAFAAGHVLKGDAAPNQRNREWGQLGLKTYELQMAGSASQSKGSLLMRPKNAAQGAETPARASRRDSRSTHGAPAPARAEAKQPAPAASITKGEQSVMQPSEFDDAAQQE